MPKISALPPAGTLADDDETPFNDKSVTATKKFTLAGLMTWLQSVASWVTTAMINNGAITPSKLGLASQTATVATAQTTTSASIVDLATVGPSVTVTIGANGMCLILAQVSYQNSVIAEGANLFYTISGATTVAGTAMMNTPRAARAATNTQTSVMALVTGLNAGSNTIKLQYGQNSGGTSTYAARVLVVIPL